MDDLTALRNAARDYLAQPTTGNCRRLAALCGADMPPASPPGNYRQARGVYQTPSLMERVRLRIRRILVIGE